MGRTYAGWACWRYQMSHASIIPIGASQTAEARDVSCVPTADVSRCSKLRLQTGGGSLDQMIRPMEQRLGDIQAERLRSLQIDYQIKLGGLLDGEITRLVAP